MVRRQSEHSLPRFSPPFGHGRLDGQWHGLLDCCRLSDEKRPPEVLGPDERVQLDTAGVMYDIY